MCWGAQGFSDALLKHLRAENVKELLLCLDGDEAGRQGAQRLRSRLIQENFRVRDVVLPEGQDPLALATQGSAADLKACLLPELRAAPLSGNELGKAYSGLYRDEDRQAYLNVRFRQGKLSEMVMARPPGLPEL